MSQPLALYSPTLLLLYIWQSYRTETRGDWQYFFMTVRSTRVGRADRVCMPLPRPVHAPPNKFTTVVNVVYPEVYDKFLSVINLVNFDLGLIPSVSCVVNINFYGRLLFATLAPLAVLGALGLTYVVARSRNRDSPEGLQAAKRKHLSVALFVMFVVYSSVSFTVFQVRFPCWC